MPNLNDYPETCERCHQGRTCNDAGLCHQCEQLEREEATDENGDTPGGYAL